MPVSAIYGTHMFWVKEGVGADQDNRPSFSASDKVGICTALSVEPQIEEREIFEPLNGRLYRTDVQEFKRAHNFTATIEQVSPIFWQALLNTLALTAGTDVQYNPNEGTTMKGWCQFQFYDTNNTLINTIAIWSRLKPAGAVNFGPDLTKIDLVGMEIYSTENNGTLAVLA